MQVKIPEKFIGKTVCVACSGGSDSMALLHYLNARKTETGINVVAVNVEHGIRGDTSVGDSAFVKTYCDDNDIVCYQYKVDSPARQAETGETLEEAARALRYDCFKDVLCKGYAD
ncbi:MAG: tRNA(Ile)-lysidine synthetase, partial [Clostridia bacterium]|nr:tRNA(Ile)-lysidine synthetase [Clostridia bacterium]